VRQLISLLVVILGCQISLGVLQAQPLVITLDAIEPPVFQVGQERELRLIGSNLQDVEQLMITPTLRVSDVAQWRQNSEPASQVVSSIGTLPVELPPLPFDDFPQKNNGVFRIAVDASVEPGLYDVVAIGKYGASNPKSIMIVDTPIEALPDTVTDGTIPECKVGITYWGKAKAQDRQRMQLSPQQGQFRFVCSSAVFDSQALPKLVLKNPKGKVLRSNRSVGRLPTAVGYEGKDGLQLEIVDELFRGGESFPFALCVNPGPKHPLVWGDVSLPASAVNATGLPTWQVTFAGSGHEWSATGTSEFQFGNSQSFVVVVQGESKSLWECQIVSNCLGHASDYRLVAYQRKNAEGSLEGQMQLTEDSPGIGNKGVIAGHLDPLMTVSMPEGQDPKFYLLVQSLQSRSNELNRTVRLRVGPPTPRFACLAHWAPWSNTPAQSRSAGAVLRRGGKCPVHIVVMRHGGFNGPVQISMESPSPGVTCPTVVVPEGQNEIDVLISASEDAAPWAGPVRFWSQARIQDVDVKQSVQGAVIWRGFSSERGPPQSRLVSDLWLKVSEDLAPISVDVKSDVALQAKAGEKVSIPLTIKRRPGGEAKFVLRAQNLPPKSALGDGEVAANVDTATRELALNAETPPGEYTVCFLAEMTWKLPVHPESHTRYVAYRDRLQAKLSAETDAGKKTAIESALVEANKRIEQLAKDTAPRDFPTFFYTGDFQLKVEKP
jgi:hypothetical protein